MKIIDRNKILEQLEGIQKFNISEVIAQYYGKETDYSAIAIGPYPVDIFIKFFNNCIGYLKTELKTDNFYIYPIQGVAQPIAGINLVNVLNSIIRDLESNQILDLPGFVDKLITYETYFGFWHLATHKVHSVKESQIKDKSEKLDLLHKKINQDLKSVLDRIKLLEEQKTELDNFVASKKSELEKTKTNLATSANETAQINKYLETSKQLKNQIDVIHDQQNIKLKEIKTELESEKRRFEDFQTDAKKLENELNNGLKESVSSLKEAKEQIVFIENKRNEIIRLIGHAADGAMGFKFEHRQQNIEKGVSFWKWAVPFAIVVNVIWIITVFVWIKADFNNPWLDLGINLLKTSPAFVLAGWVLKQYSKERNLQEEYAFKSAVAMTISSYNDLLKENDSENNKSSQQMILAAIKELHASPKLHNEKGKDFSKNRLRGALDSLKQLQDLIKEVKN